MRLPFFDEAYQKLVFFALAERDADVFGEPKARESTHNHAVLFKEEYQVLSLGADVYADKVSLSGEYLESKRFKFRLEIGDACGVEFESLLDVFLVRKRCDCRDLGGLVYVERRLDFPQGRNDFFATEGVADAKPCKSVNFAEGMSIING